MSKYIINMDQEIIREAGLLKKKMEMIDEVRSREIGGQWGYFYSLKLWRDFSPKVQLLAPL